VALFERAAGALIAAAAAVLAFPGAASAAGTPRAQFWDEPYFQGYKLDKDVSVSNSWGQWTTVPDLSKEGLSCWFCSGNWDNRITSLSTTGGGQSPVDLLAYTETYYRGMCVYIHKNVQLRDLAAEEIPVRYPDGRAVSR